MSSSLGAWGVPDFGSVVRRKRLTDLFTSYGTRAVILFGPSGCGKSIAAAHWSECATRTPIWVDAGGGFPSVEGAVRCVTRALERSSGGCPESAEGELQLADLLESNRIAIEAAVGAAGVCVILDDVGAPDDGADVRGLAQLARSLRSSSSQLVVTTRSITRWPADVLCEWVPVGPTELALTDAEASQLLDCAGLSRLIPESAELVEACAGHAAVFSVLASQAATHGVESTVARTTSLEAWLELLILEQMPQELRTSLLVLSLVKSGTERDLAELGIADPRKAITDLAAAIPLVAVSRTAVGSVAFRVHDLVDGFLWDRHLNSGPEMTDHVTAAMDLLTRRGDLMRAAVLLDRANRIELHAEWLEENGRELLSSGIYQQLLELIEATPVHDLMARPRVLILWAELCCEIGRLEDALVKCQAVRSLAEHSGDGETVRRAISLSMQCLCRLHRLEEAERLSMETLGSSVWEKSRTLRGEALMCLGRARLTRGEDARDRANPV